MAFIDWSPQLSVKVDEMDKEHKKLVGYVNQLHEAMKEGRGKEQMLPVLEKVVTYTVQHFKSEESYMERIHFDRLEEHIVKHNDLAAQAGDYLAKAKAGESIPTVKLLNFLRTWLVEHIQKDDLAYGLYQPKEAAATQNG